MYQIREWPHNEQPIGRLENLGPRALARRELLALLIGTGTPATAQGPARTALDLADMLIAESAAISGSCLRALSEAPLASLCRIPGIGRIKAARVMAALELGRRTIDEARPERTRVRCAADVYQHIRLRMQDLSHEEFHVLLLNTQNEILHLLQVTRGTLDASLVHPREVFRPAITHAAAGVILIHNHPTGDPTPSAEDRSVTRQLRNAGQQIGIEVMDHVIIGEGRYTSFAEAGLLN